MNCVKLSLFIILNLCLVNCEKRDPTIIIIGAGASGIATASLLSQNGLNNFLILEAENRIGGRIYSIDFGDAKVDLGAQWSHGEQNNTLYRLIEDLDLLEPGNLSNNFYYSSRSNFNRSIAKELYYLCKDTFLKQNSMQETTIGDYMEDRYISTVSETYNKHQTILKYAHEILNCFKHEILMQRGAYCWYDISLHSDYDRLKGTAYLDWKGRGHGMILDVMMMRYPNPIKELPIAKKILFNKEVIKIIWDPEMNGTLPSVICADGSEYAANHIIFTGSLGVLKDYYQSLFYPHLPVSKIQAIDTLGIGSVVKVALQFSNMWWKEEDFRAAIICWDSADLMLLSREFPIGPIKNNKSWLENLSEIHVAQKNPNVLIAWFTGEFVPDIELLSDEFISEGIMHVLFKFFGDRYNITKPVRILRNNWGLNPHFRGVYSYETVQSRRLGESAALRLAQPLLSKNGNLSLLFAGEATSPTHYATVHGAIESGHREALRIIKLYK